MSYRGNTPTVTKKQVGIVYREIMRGALTVPGRFKPGRVYDCAGYAAWATSNLSGLTERERLENEAQRAMLQCVDAIFAGNMGEAQNMLNVYFDTLRAIRKA